MNNYEERLEKYKKNLVEEQEKELKKNSTLIVNFINFCKSKKIILSNDNFSYIRTIGIVANYPNLLYFLNNNLSVDKENLVLFDTLLTESHQKDFMWGYLYADNYMIMAHPYFRREYYSNNNFAPRFIENFWAYKKPNTRKYIALDFDRVRINVDTSKYIELDTWYGAKFKKDISTIENGIVKLRPPSGVTSFYNDFLFGNIYSLDIKWNTNEGIKVFQAEEFKNENSIILKDGKKYFPAKYIHAEFDTSTMYFRHFDGAIHFYTESEYYSRRESDLNYNNKNEKQLKTISQKLFKINGKIDPLDWANLTSQYLSGNPFIQEYFEGKIPDDLNEIIEKLKNYKK